MTHQQILLFVLLGVVLGLLLWGRFRHDLVAGGGLFAGVLLGLVPQDKAFDGFANPAVLVVALVLIASRAFENSGALGLITGRLLKGERSVTGHIALVGGIGAALSAIINNVAALALLMPIDIQAARRAGRSPSVTLMPLAFATVLGGLVTLIGTPPNIIASSYRQKALGAPYQMFDFTPVGLAVAVVGVVFVAFFGWRLLPKARREAPPMAEAEEFIAEIAVPADSALVGKQVGELDGEAEQADVMIAGVIRGDRRVPGRLRFAHIEAGDVLAVEGPTDGIAAFIKALELHQPDDKPMPRAAARLLAEADRSEAKGDQAAQRRSTPAIVEAVVRADARIAGRSAASFRLRSRFGVTLLGIAHEGRTFREQVRTRIIAPGDVLLLAGPRAALNHVVDWLGAISINEASVAPAQTWRIVVALGLFAAAVVAASTGLLSFTVAIGIAVAGYAATGLVPAREFYDQIDWPVVVMLACLLPLGTAFENVGGTTLLANMVLGFTQGAPVAALSLVMVVTMTLSNVLNNVATMVIAGPLAVAIALKLGVSADTFLMGAAVATSSAFLTPIGHKNNTLIMGPGGYAFGDYWRVGLPLQAIVLVVAIPLILVVWPL